MYVQVKKCKRILIAAVFILLLVCFCSASRIYAESQPGIQTLGLLVMGKDVKGTEGFQKTMIYLTSEELEQLKTDKNPEQYGLGDSWVENKLFSSYEDHGTPVYHYSRVDGLDVKEILNKVAKDGFDANSLCWIYSSDGSNAKVYCENWSDLKYYAPGDATGVIAPNPMIALYKTTNEAENAAIGSVPEGPAERLAQGEEVFVFGQKKPEDANNCSFVKYVNALFVEDPVTSLKSDTPNLYKSVRLNHLLEWGIYEKDYSFTADGKEITHRVKGIPLSEVLEQMELTRYMPDYADTRVSLISENGESRLLEKEELNQCFIAWGYADDTETPKEQTGEIAVYMQGDTQEESIFYNLKKINITDKNGTVLTSVPEKEQKPESPKVTAPAAPSVKAAKNSYNSVKLSWNKVKGAGGYKVYRYDGKSKSWKLRKALSASVSSYVDKNLATNTKYRYKVKSYTGTLESAFSKEVSATPKLNKGKITKLKKSGKNAVKLKWSAVPGANGYQVYRANKKSGKYKRVATLKKRAKTTFTNKKLKRGKRYYYKVRAYRIVDGEKQYGSFSTIRKIKR